MKLYYSKGTCSLAVRIAIHEMQAPCEFEAVDLKTKKTVHKKDYLEINPKGSVPALQLDDGQILTENAVIQQYLADKYHATTLLSPVGLMQRYRILEWLNFCSTDIHKSFSPLFNPAIPQEVKNEVFIPALEKKLNIMDKHLAEHSFLVGDPFTLPDGYLFVMLRWLPNVGMDLAKWPNLTRYFNTIAQRKSVILALQEEADGK